MRRSSRGEQAAFSLFPFLAVLLCTMGALVVLLVSVMHVSRTKALREAEIAAAAAEAEAARLAADSPERERAERALAEAQRVAAQLADAREQGAERLEQEQARLSDLEDHLDRLRDEAQSLQTEAQELFAVEQEHYDDEKIAREELQRLNTLMGELEEEIEELKHAATGRERRFAVVPLRDKTTGTLRPPVYYECTARGVTLQPEGVELVWEDLVAPQFSGPLAAVARAVGRFYEERPETRAANEVGAPYPLLVVRPDGVNAYYHARSALDAAGVEFGYQPIGEDWPVEYGQLNPLLMQWAEEALANAREERRGMARMVPRLAQAMAGADAAANKSLRAAGVGAGADQPSGGGIQVVNASPESNNPFEGLRIEGVLPNADPSGEPGYGHASGSPEGASGRMLVLQGQASDGPAGAAASGPAGVASRAPADAEETSTASEQANGEAAGQRVGALSAADLAAANGSTSSGQQQTAGATPQAAVTVSPLASGGGGERKKTEGHTAVNTRSGVPMVRPIRVYVANDRVVVLPDRAQSPGDGTLAASNPASIPLDGPTTDTINEVIAALKRHADSWGIAGEGMYWDPRLQLNVAGDGAQRADDLRRLFETAGIKVQAYPVTTASKPNGEAGATR